MSTTTNPRDINVLLGLGTYQGMTDEEIDLIINYKANLLYESTEATQKRANIENATSTMITDNHAAAQQAVSMIESMLDRAFATLPAGTAETVQPTLITYDSTEV